MNVKELRGKLVGLPDDAEVVCQLAHCCGQGGATEDGVVGCPRSTPRGQGLRGRGRQARHHAGLLQATGGGRVMTLMDWWGRGRLAWFTKMAPKERPSDAMAKDGLRTPGSGRRWPRTRRGAAHRTGARRWTGGRTDGRPRRGALPATWLRAPTSTSRGGHTWRASRPGIRRCAPKPMTASTGMLSGSRAGRGRCGMDSWRVGMPRARTTQTSRFGAHLKPQDGPTCGINAWTYRAGWRTWLYEQYDYLTTPRAELCRRAGFAPPWSLMEAHHRGQDAAIQHGGTFHTVPVDRLHEMKWSLTDEHPEGWFGNLAYRCGYEREYGRHE